MVQIRKTSNIVSLSRGRDKRIAGTSTASQTTSPFALKPIDSLKAITDRKSRDLTEEQKLAILQRALEPYAKEAHHHLPEDIQTIEEKVRSAMLKEGFPNEVATEASDETITALLENRSKVGRA